MSSQPYQPFGACSDLMYNHSPEVLIAGPAGTGKSLACLTKLYIMAAKYPGSRHLMVRNTRESCTESILVTFETHVLPVSSPVRLGAQRLNRHSYSFPNSSEIVIGGMNRSERIMSTDYDTVYVAEATELTEGAWQDLSTRVNRPGRPMPYSQMVADCNPSAPTHWLKQRCDVGTMVMLESRHEDNPRLYDHKLQEWTDEGRIYLARLDTLTGARLERLRYGRWVAAEGVVYEEWDPRVHLIDRFDIPDYWRRIGGIDFGFINPFVSLWVALDEDGRMFVYRQLYRSRRIVEDHAAQMLAVQGAEAIEATVADHDREDRATLERHGVYTIPARKEIKIGIDALKERLRIQPDGRARLYVMRDSLIDVDEGLMEAKRPWCLEQEFDSYHWRPAQDGRPTKDEPVDMDNHALDALRYAVRYADEFCGVVVPASIERRIGRRESFRSV